MTKLYSHLVLVGLCFVLYVSTQAQCSVSVNGTQNIKLCGGQTTGLFATVTGGTPANYKWTSIPSGTTGNTSSISVSPGDTTLYVITVSGNGCSATDTVSVNVVQPPPSQLEPGTGVDTITLGGVLNFSECVNTAQQGIDFIFTNPNQDPSITSTFTWGDTGATVSQSGNWNKIDHIYGRGQYYLTYTTNNGNGCPGTSSYIVYFGNNPAGGIASLGSTSICGPDSLRFAINNWQSNSPGTIYTISFNDGTPPLTFGQPPPDTISHWFSITSCGTTSSNGTISFTNAFKAALTVTNPCGVTAGSVVPIYVSFAPKTDYILAGGDTVCQNVPNIFVNKTINGEAASVNGCQNNSPVLWSVIPATGWTIAAGTLGSNNGYIGPLYNPANWTSGSDSIQFNFSNTGTYQVQLVSGNSCGIDTIIKTICVTSAPNPSFTLSANEGCAPLTINGNNSTTALNNCGDPVFAWKVAQDSFSCNPTVGGNYEYTGGTSNSSDTPTIQFNNQGVYRVMLNAANVCGTVAATQQVVTVKTVPQASITAPPLICAGLDVSASGNFQACAGTISAYNWIFQGGTPATFSGPNPGSINLGTSGPHTITLEVTNECGTGTDSTVVLLDTIPTAIAGPAAQICSGNSVQIGGNAVLGLNYAWTPTAGLNAANISSPTVTLINGGSTPDTTMYYLTATNSVGCSGTDSVLVIVFPPAIVSAGTAASVCAGQQINLSGSFGGGASSVIWTSSNGGTFGNVNAALTTYTPSIASGTVNLTLSTDNPVGPCPAATSTLPVTVVAQPVASPGSDQSVCSGTVVQLGGASQLGYSYTWSPATGLDDINISNPTSTLTDTGTTVLQQTYTLVVSGGTCFDTAQVTISVYPAAIVNIDSSVSVCAGQSVALAGSIGGSATSATWSSASGSFNPADSPNTLFTPSIASGTAHVTLTTNEPSAYCSAAVASVTVTVNPVPAATANPGAQTVCNGASTSGISITSNLAGTNFDWTGASPDSANITGYITSGNGSPIPSQNLITTDSAQGVVVYVITPSKQGCAGPAITDSIYINPSPLIKPIPAQTICSGGSTTLVNPGSYTAGTSFTWTASAGGNISGFVSSGTGSIPVQTITNSGYTTDSVVFTITPGFSSCGGSAINFDVIVNPLPNVVLPPAGDICSGGLTAEDTLGSKVTGATFSWTASATAGLSGFTPGGTGNILPQTIFNPGTAAGTVTYSITPAAAGCTGSVQNYFTTVKPIPNVSLSPSPDTICTTTQTNISLSSDVSGTTFSWTYNEPATVTGAADGNGSAIQQVLTNSTLNEQSVNYFVTPVANGCPGAPDTATVVIGSSIILQLPPNQTICSGQSTQVVPISSNPANATITWTSQANGANGVTASGTDSIPVQTLLNNGNTPAVVTYIVTATYANCATANAEYDITVNPVPQMVLAPFQTICSNLSTVNIDLQSTASGATYTWSGSSPDGVTGFVANGTTNVIPGQTLNDTNNTSGIVVYVIQPSYNGCPGQSANDTITVSPQPLVAAITPQTVCSGSSSAVVNLSSNASGATFSWIASASAGISGFSNSGNGDIPAQTFTNTNNAPGIVTYTINADAGGCLGPGANYVVTVKPLPVAVSLPAIDTICPSAQSNIALTSNVGGTIFSWTETSSANVSGASNGSGSAIQQSLSNSGTNAGTVTYVITPSAGGCPGLPDTALVVVHPGPNVQFSLPDQTVCTGQTTQPVAISSSSPGVTFSWTSEANGAGGIAPSGTDTIPAQVVTNPGNSVITVTYTVVVGFSTCANQTAVYNINITPAPQVILPPAQSTCTGASTQDITIGSNVAGTTFTWSGSSPDGVKGFIKNGTASDIPSQILTNNDSTPGLVIYAVSPNVAGCPGLFVYDTIIVKPQPIVNPLSPQTICSGASSANISLSSSTVGTTFVWTGSSASLTGFTPSGFGNIPPQIISNSGHAIDSVVYSITPSANGCVGNSLSDVITVNPVADVVLTANQVICSNQSTIDVPFASDDSGTTFSWTSITTGNLSGFTASGTGDIPAQVITNTGNVPATITYIVTPAANGCPGTIANYLETVKPLPTVTALPSPDTICPSTETDISLSSNISGSVISWVAVEPAAVTGATNGTGSSIQQIMANSSASPQTVLYIITDTVNGCPGPVDTAIVEVLPGVALQFSMGAQTICSGQNTKAVAISSLSPGVTFSWTSQANGVGGVANSGTDTIPVQTLLNNGDFGLAVDYFITAGYNGCPTTSSTYNIEVNPAPTALLPPFQSICSGTASQVISLSSNVPGTAFTWTGASPDGVTGFTTSGNGALIPSQTLVNNASTTGLVVYNITSSSAGCPGVAVSDTLRVKPYPTINPLVTQAICSGATSAEISPTSATPGTTYNWSVIYNGDITGFIANGADSIPAQSLVNTGQATDSVTYAVTPTARGCTGPSLNYDIVVYPVADVVLPGSQQICSGTSTATVTLSSDIVGTTFMWTASGSAGTGGFLPGGSDSIPAQTLVDSNKIPATVTYTISPTANGCSGTPTDYIVSVKPLPVATVTPAADTVCPSSQTDIAFASNLTGTIFSWTVISPPGITGAASGTGAAIQQTLFNNSLNSKTVQYFITPEAKGCSGATDTVSVLVRPDISVQFSAGPQTICSGQSSQAVVISSASPGVTISWTSQSNGLGGVSLSGNDTIPVQTLINTGYQPLSATYNVVSGYNGCPAIPASYEITVNPNPALILPPAQTICSGSASQAIDINSGVSGTTFTWNGASTNGITGYPLSGSGAVIPSEILINTDTTQGSVVFSITPSSTGCPGVSENDTIYVNPLPHINLPPFQAICSGTGDSTIVLTATPSATLFNWSVTYSGNETGYTSIGSGNIGAETITNTGITIDSVVYTIVPAASGCIGPSLNYDVIVNPTANVILPQPQSVCSGTTTTRAVLSSDVNGTTFSWTATATAGLTGFTASGTGNIPAQTLVNRRNIDGNVTYSITPYANMCAGPVSDYVVIVKPSPAVIANPAADTICPSAETNIALSSNVAGTTFSWTVTGPPAITGFAAGNGNSIQQVLSNSSSQPQQVNYFITPAANGCVGQPDTVDVVINPGVAIQFSLANQTICSGQATQAVVISSASPGVAISWTSQTNGLGGVLPSGNDTIPVQTLTNTAFQPLSATYNVVAGYNGCPGSPASYEITVNPNPALILPAAQTICSGGASQAIDINSAVTGTTFTWTGAGTNGTTGYPLSGSSAVIPSEILINTDTIQGAVVFSITPSSTGCPGALATDTIYVNPLPEINLPVFQTICSGSSDSIVVLSGTPATTLFNWSVTYSGNETGYTSSGSGNIGAETVTNTGITIDSVVYTIIPAASGCTGPSRNYDVIVNPTPNVILPQPQSVCSGATTTRAVLSGDVNGTTFSWTATASAGVTGFTASGTGNIPAETLVNRRSTDGTVTYSITPSANMCAGPPSNYVIIVKPSPAVIANPAVDTICPSAETNIALSSNVAGTTFSWTVNGPGTITGFAAGDGNTIQQVLSNSSPQPQQVNYFITPASNGCVGPPDTVSVVINPGVVIQFSPANQTICSGQSIQSVLISSSSPGVNYPWTSQANGVTGVTSSGTDSIPVQTLVNSGNTTLTVNYNVLASYPGCPAYASTYSIVVNPTPNVLLPAFQTICSGTPTQIIPINSNVSGTTFNWQGSSPDAVTGFIASGSTSDIPSQTLTNSSALSGIVVYEITPASSGCPGLTINDTITVNPLPTVIPAPAQTICSGFSSQTVVLNSATPGTTFTWIVGYHGNLSGYTPFGADSITAQIITNNGYATDSVVYTISPAANTCNGPNANFDIIVNPTPDVILPPAQTICSGTQTLPVTPASHAAGTNFTWVATSGNGITGFTASGNNDIPVQTLVNPINVPGTVTYAITPSALTCAGLPVNYLVTVSPLPQASASPSPDTICTASETNIILSSSVIGSSFTWYSLSPASIAGAGNGSGSPIQNTLVNSDTTPGTVFYVITPEAAGCTGPADTMNVVVNPGAAIQFTPANQTICSGQQTQLVNISSPASGASFSWTSQANGVAGVAASGTSSIPVQTLTNNGNITDTVLYTVTSEYLSCPGETAVYFIPVKPVPHDILPAAQTICSGANSAAILLTSTVAGATFFWTGSSTNGVTGFTDKGLTSTIPSQTLVNGSDTAGSVIFSIIPIAEGCNGPDSAYTITVNPLPDVILPAAQIICDRATSNAVNLTSDIPGSTFSWTSAANGTLSGNTASGSGNIPAQTLHNSGSLADTLTFSIAASALGCVGPDSDYMIVVNPTPAVNFAPGAQTLCDGQTSLAIAITSATPAVNISWTSVAATGLTGADTSGTNVIPAQTLFNTLIDTFPRPLQVVYTAQAVTSNPVCPGTPANYVITVEPAPSVTSYQTINSGCSPLSVDFFPATLNYGIPDSLVYNWGDGSPDSSLYPSAVAPMWYPVTHIFYNDSSAPKTFTITLTAHNACIDTAVKQTVTVLPNQISAYFTAEPATGCAPLFVTLHNLSTGPATLSWCFDYNTQTDSCMGAAEVDTAAAPVTYTYTAGTHTVALYINNGFGCAHDSAFQTITVTPSPVSNFTYNNNTCAELPVTFKEEASINGGGEIAAYNWNFGDNTVSLIGNPVHIYDTAGVYNACLTVTSTYGCSDTNCQPVNTLNKPIVNFTYTDTCLNKQPTEFVNTSRGAVDFSWNFGDGNTSDLDAPGHAYTDTGTYQVTLMGVANGCSDTITQAVVVYPVPSAAFTVPVQFTCGVPVSIPMTNTSTGAIGYNWSFGNGTTSIDNNPEANYTNQALDTITLIASNIFGCYDTAVHQVHVYAYPTLDSINVTPSEGCQPVNVQFTANAGNTTQYVWNFGDSSGINSSASPTTSHLYADTGTYSVSLYIYSYPACGDTFLLPDTVSVHINPTASFEHTQNETSQLDTGSVQFINTSQNSNSYEWSFGDGDSSTNTNPAHFYQYINTYEVTLIASTDFGCRDTATQNVKVIKKSLFIPNALAPEFTAGSNLVQEWKPAGMGLLEYHAQVFNKWGELMWESTAITDDDMKSPAEGWNGYYQGVICPQGVYVWKIEAVFLDGNRWEGARSTFDETPKKIGDVTLIR
jgi:PKD repeat protein